MTGDALVLTGYGHSVYTRIARMVLAEKGLAYSFEEVNPFSDPPGLRDLHPFGRVPVLQHGGFCVFETTAITAYLDTAFDGPSLTPTAPKAMARMMQVISIVDAYAYWPLVRQVYSHRVFRPAFGETVDEDAIANGVQASTPVLAALEDIAAEALILTGQTITRADCHLAPIIAAFVQAPEGRKLLARHPALSQWWGQITTRASLIGTAKPLPTATPRP